MPVFLLRMYAVGLLLLALAATGVEAFVLRGVQLSRMTQSSACRRSMDLTVVMMAKAKGASKSAKVQVLLKEDVEGIGKANEVVMVNTGYYNNFLRPKNKGHIISDEEVKVKEAKELEELEAIKQNAIEMGTTIEALCPLIMKRKVGKGNNIVGKITHKQIADAISAKADDKVKFTQKMKWTVPDVQGLGEFTCSVQLHPEVTQSIKVDVQAEK